MGRNAIQLQQGLSFPEFQQRYGTEAQCEEALVQAAPVEQLLRTLGWAGLLPLRCSCRLQPRRCRDRWPSSQ